MKLVFTALLLAIGCNTFAAEVVPPVPALYFNDYAKVVSPATVTRLNATLENFERESSSQIVVAIFTKMQSDSSIEDYTVRVAQSWRVGQKAKDNGAVLFVFIQDRKMFLQVGYGLEGVLPDATCKRIIEDEIKPSFKAGDFNAGLTAGVNAILAAAKGEYKGTVRPAANGRSGRRIDPGFMFFMMAFGGIATFILFIRWKVRAHSGNWHGWTISSGGSSGGWSSGGGGGGGFSSGGGSFGGGGAGGSW